MPMVVVVAFIAVVLLCAANWAFTWQLAKQSGRMLLLFEQLEEEIDLGNAVRADPSARTPLRGYRPLSDSRIERNGLPPGTVAPLFDLQDITGASISLHHYRGRRVLLLFSDPQCSPCNQLARHLGRRQTSRGGQAPAVVMVSRGSVEENRRKAEAHGFDFPVALQRGWEISRLYGMFAMPAAFLIGEDGIVVGKRAKGVDEVLALVRATTAPAEPSAPVYPGSKARSI